MFPHKFFQNPKFAGIPKIGKPNYCHICFNPLKKICDFCNLNECESCSSFQLKTYKKCRKCGVKCCINHISNLETHNCMHRFDDELNFNDFKLIQH